MTEDGRLANAARLEPGLELTGDLARLHRGPAPRLTRVGKIDREEPELVATLIHHLVEHAVAGHQAVKQQHRRSLSPIDEVRFSRQSRTRTLLPTQTDRARS